MNSEISLGTNRPGDATQSVPVALIIAIRFNQACTIHIQVVTIGATNYTRRPVVAIQRLVVKPTRIPVIVARIYIRQWIMDKGKLHNK